VLAAFAALLVAGSIKSRELRLHYELWRLRRTEPREIRKALEALAARGDWGMSVVEAVAFVSEPAPSSSETRALRQAALDVVWRHDSEREVPLSEERCARYLVEARGLKRDDAMQAVRHLDRVARSDVLREAAIETMLTDPDREGSMQACLHLSYNQDRRALPALRRAALASPHENTRYYATCIGLSANKEEKEEGPGSRMWDPENVPTIRRVSTTDPEPMNRVVAAMVLAMDYGDATGLGILLASPGWKGARSWEHLSLIGVRAIRDKRCVAALIRATETSGNEAAQSVGRAANIALEKITGTELAPGETWKAWFESHRTELPSQVDPEPAAVEIR
jgi:hypothetical protein